MTRHSPGHEFRPPDGGSDVKRPNFAGPGEFTRLLEHPDVCVAAVVLALFLTLVFSVGWLAIPCCIVLELWRRTRRFRLPFRMPMAWSAADYSNSEPGHSRRFRPGQGLLHLGNEISTNEELWITNSDARRHALVLGTTGAGKALPLDTLVLTTEGWRQNGNIKPGNKVVHPSGKASTVISIHPQGLQPVARLLFADGRFADCSHDHLWRIRVLGAADATLLAGCNRTRLMTAADIALMTEVGATMPQRGQRLRAFVPLVCPAVGSCTGNSMDTRSAAIAGSEGFDRLPFVPSLTGSAKERLNWACRALRQRHHLAGLRAVGRSLEIPLLGESDGHVLRNLVWSLGGMATQIAAGDRLFATVAFPGQENVLAEIPPCDPLLVEYGLEITGVEVFSGGIPIENGTVDPDLIRKVRMSCLRTDAPDGMFVIENHIATHNTELLLGIASQSMMWSSGFMFIDGKGTTEFHAKVWSLVSLFGRQDDYRMLNFTDSGGHPDDPAGGPAVHSNTLNPFSHGSADQLMNLIVSLMSETGTAGDMWKGRAMSLVTSTMKALCEMRDAGDVLLDVQSIRDFLPLGTGVRKEFLEGQKITGIEEIPDAAWEDMKSRGGMIELYLRALHGEFSERSRLALKGFFDSLPGFRLEAALNGEPQEGKAVEQHGFLSMQLTRPLGSLADDFGHIFRTPFGEVDIEDVVLNRRILVVLLPALQKAPEEMRNCGKIVVSMLKMMMGRAAGSILEGSKHSLVDARPTRSPSPFIAILDEAGYYMVKGIDTMMAQARSLGFMIVIAGQDMAAMQSVSPQIAETVAANARLTAAGATEDAQRTWVFLKNKFSTHRVPVAAGRSARNGLLGTRWVERPDVSFVMEDRVRIGDLQRLREGEFYFMMESRLVKARAFHAGANWTPWISMNKFLLIRGPTDRAPGLDQSKDTEFLSAIDAAGKAILDLSSLERNLRSYPFDSQDALFCAIRYSEKQASGNSGVAAPQRGRMDADLVGIMFGPQHSIAR